MCFVHEEYRGKGDQLCEWPIHPLGRGNLIFFNPFSQVVLWRIHRSDVSELARSVTGVSAQGKGARGYSMYSFCLGVCHTTACDQQQRFGTFPLLFCSTHVIGTGAEEECDRQGINHFEMH